MIKVKGREVKKRWIVLFAALAAICGLGLGASPEEGLFEMTNESLWANVAWMITATIFVLMMTPGLSFFYGGMVRAKNVIDVAEFHRHGSGKCDMGGVWFRSGLRQ